MTGRKIGFFECLGEPLSLTTALDGGVDRRDLAVDDHLRREKERARAVAGRVVGDADDDFGDIARVLAAGEQAGAAVFGKVATRRAEVGVDQCCTQIDEIADLGRTAQTQEVGVVGFLDAVGPLHHAHRLADAR